MSASLDGGLPMILARLPIDPARYPVLATGAGAALDVGSRPQGTWIRFCEIWMPPGPA